MTKGILVLKRSIFAATMVFLFACQTHGQNVGRASVFSMTADTTAYQPSDTIHLVFVNDSNVDVYVDFMCSTAMERHDKDGWIEVYAQDCSRIRVRPTVIAARTSANGSFPAGPIEEGISTFADYRICAKVSYGSETDTVCSTTFRLTPAKP